MNSPRPSTTNGVGVEFILHSAQFASLLAFAGGLGVAVWNLMLSLKEGRWGAKLLAIALTGAFAVMLWISMSYHLIGISGEY